MYSVIKDFSFNLRLTKNAVWVNHMLMAEVLQTTRLRELRSHDWPFKDQLRLSDVMEISDAALSGRDQKPWQLTIADELVGLIETRLGGKILNDEQTQAVKSYARFLENYVARIMPLITAREKAKTEAGGQSPQTSPTYHGFTPIEDMELELFLDDDKPHSYELQSLTRTTASIQILEGLVRERVLELAPDRNKLAKLYRLGQINSLHDVTSHFLFKPIRAELTGVLKAAEEFKQVAVFHFFSNQARESIE